VEFVSIHEQRLNAGPISFAIPGNAQHHAGFVVFLGRRLFTQIASFSLWMFANDTKARI
jgi:hypothetical protein